MIKQYFLLTVLSLIIFSCVDKNQEYNIYSNCDLTKIAEVSSTKKMPYCVVLIDSTSFSIDNYLQIIKTYTTLHTDVVFNFININLDKNKWYSKILSPQIYPITCIFNKDSNLYELIPGNSKESILYLEKAIKTEAVCEDFHYNQLYRQDKILFINYINNILKVKSKIYNSEDIIKDINFLLCKKEHPYLLYLKLQNQIHFNKINEAKETAQKFLTYDTVQNLIDYYDERIIANQILDSTYNIKNAPLITSVSKEIELSNCIINRTYVLSINISNIGKRDLKISDILTSCSCVEIKCPKKFIIRPNKSINLNVHFSAEVLGDISREIYIASNSISTPIYLITINAKVKEQ